VAFCVDELVDEGVPAADRVGQLVPNASPVEPAQHREVVPKVGDADERHDGVDHLLHLPRLLGHVRPVVGVGVPAPRQGLHENAVGEVEQAFLELDPGRGAAAGRAREAAHHGAQLAGENGVGHEVDAARGEELQDGDFSRGAPVVAVVGEGERLVVEGGLPHGGEVRAVGERGVEVGGEALPGELPGGDDDGGARAEAEREDRAIARGEARERGVERLLE
jgi:hypothetical protein